MADKNSKLSIRTALPQVSKLNKKTIMVLAGTIALVILLVLMMAISPQKAQGPSSKVKPGQYAGKNGDSLVKGLPTGYQDARLIDRMLERNKKPQIIEKIPPAVQRQLSELQASQSRLQAELMKLRTQPKPKFKPPVSPQDREAQLSSIFFSGGAPRPLPRTPQNPLAKHAAKSAAAAGSKGHKPSGYDAQNAQSVKMDFFDSKPDKNIYNKNQVQYPASKYIVQAGTVLPAILQSQIVSDNPGFVEARVNNDVYDSITGRHLLIPKGSVIMGQYNSKVTYAQSIIQVKFTRVIRPDGTSIVLPNEPGVNEMGMSGLEDDVDNHWGRVIGAGILSAVFSLPSIVAQNQLNQNTQFCTQNADGSTNCSGGGVGRTIGASALQSVGQTVSSIGDKVASRSLNIQPTITINAGKRFSIMVTKDFVMPPYSKPIGLF